MHLDPFIDFLEPMAHHKERFFVPVSVSGVTRKESARTPRPLFRVWFYTE